MQFNVIEDSVENVEDVEEMLEEGEGETIIQEEELLNSDYDPEDFQQKYPSSAGILCYSITPCKEMFFLLGKESKDELNYPDRSFWCDFAGGVEEGEDEEEAAAREFCEESLHCVPLDTRHVQPHEISIKEITQQLRRKDYRLKLKICLNHGAPTSVPRKYHCVFVKQIPWNPQLPKIFNFVREKMLSLKSHCDKAIFYRQTQLVSEPIACEKIAQLYYERLPFPLKSHPCIVQTDNGLYTVPECYLEKTCLQYWSLQRLIKTLAQGGCYYTENLRSSFIPVIAVVLDRLYKNHSIDRGLNYTIYCYPHHTLKESFEKQQQEQKREEEEEEAEEMNQVDDQEENETEEETQEEEEDFVRGRFFRV